MKRSEPNVHMKEDLEYIGIAGTRRRKVSTASDPMTGYGESFTFYPPKTGGYKIYIDGARGTRSFPARHFSVVDKFSSACPSFVWPASSRKVLLSEALTFLNRNG